MTNHDLDRALARLARRQHGAFDHDQVTGLGATDRMICHRIAVGEWVRLARGVYALTSHPATWRRQYKAAELTKAGAALCGRPAAMVHGLPGAKVLRPELVLPPGTSVRSSIACVHQGEGVPVTVIDGIRVTTLAHTLLDLLGHWPVDAVERAFDGALPSCPVHLSAPATATGRGARAHRRRRQLAHRCGVISPRG